MCQKRLLLQSLLLPSEIKTFLKTVNFSGEKPFVKIQYILIFKNRRPPACPNRETASPIRHCSIGTIKNIWLQSPIKLHPIIKNTSRFYQKRTFSFWKPAGGSGGCIHLPRIPSPSPLSPIVGKPAFEGDDPAEDNPVSYGIENVRIRLTGGGTGTALYHFPARPEDFFGLLVPCASSFLVPVATNLTSVADFLPQPLHMPGHRNEQTRDWGENETAPVPSPTNPFWKFWSVSPLLPKSSPTPHAPFSVSSRFPRTTKHPPPTNFTAY